MICPGLHSTCQECSYSIVREARSSPSLEDDFPLSPRLRDLSLAQYMRLLWPYLFMFAVGLLVGLCYPHEWPWAETISRIADALLIAGLLAIAIEIWSTSELIHRVAEDLAGRLAGSGLPVPLQEQISAIVKTELVREDYLKIYRISNPIDGRVNVEVTVSFAVKNYGDRNLKYSPEMSEESFYEPKFLRLEYALQDGNGHTFDENELTQYVKSIPSTFVRSLKGPKELKIPPLKRVKTAVCKVTWRYIITMPEEYSDVTSFGGPTIGATIRIDSLPNGFDFVSSGEGVRHIEGSSTWTFDNAFLRSQHVRVWWRKLPPDRVSL